MASTPPIVLLWLLGQLVLPCQGISLDVVAGRGSIERSVAESWQEPAVLDKDERSNPDDGCLDAEFGDSCYELVTYCLEHGLEHPEWLTTFNRTTSRERNFKQIQGILHSQGKARCGRPCSTLVQQLQRAQDPHSGGVHTTPPVQHPPRTWVATTPPTTSLEAPKAEVQAAPEGEVLETPRAEVQEAPDAKVQEAPEVKVQVAPEGEFQEAPKAEIQAAPKVEVQEAPKAEVQDAPEGEVQETPKTEVQEAPEVEVQETPNAERTDGFEMPGGHVTRADGPAPEPHVQDREVGISPDTHKQDAEEAKRPEAQAGGSGEPFVIDGYGRMRGDHWGVPGDES